jgi:GNAT superfamily N-acetyltransferase
LIAETRAAAIRYAATPRDIELTRSLFAEYAQWLKVDLCFQGFDDELATLPGAYAPPRGRLLLAGAPDEAFACIALRPLATEGGCGRGASAMSARTDASIGEVKRLYVRPAHRGEGWARRLAQMLLEEARGIGYRELKLDTLSWMAQARALYASLGFRECAPYYHNPLPGVVYMSLAL